MPVCGGAFYHCPAFAPVIYYSESRLTGRTVFVMGRGWRISSTDLTVIMVFKDANGVVGNRRQAGLENKRLINLERQVLWYRLQRFQ